MEWKTKAILFCLFCAAIFAVHTVTAATNETQKILPSESELNSFIQSVDTPSNADYTDTMSKAALKENENWPWDIWESEGTKFISFYHKSNNQKGYESIYLYGPDQEITKFCKYKNIKLIESHLGDNSKTDNKEEEVCTGPDCNNQKSCLNGNCENQKDSEEIKITNDTKKEKEVTEEQREDKKESNNDEELKFTPHKNENTFKMSNSEKAESIDNYMKAAGFDEKERKFMIECITYYWGY